MDARQSHRTKKLHRVNGRVVDKTSIQALGPDGRYTLLRLRESVRVNDRRCAQHERTFAPKEREL
jgi:hypothetical protein